MTLFFWGGGRALAQGDWLWNSRAARHWAGGQDAARAARPSYSCQGGALDPVRAGGGMGYVKAAVLSWSLWAQRQVSLHPPRLPPGLREMVPCEVTHGRVKRVLFTYNWNCFAC